MILAVGGRRVRGRRLSTSGDSVKGGVMVRGVGLCLVLSLSSAALPVNSALGDLTLVHSEDFDADPGWVTDQPGRSYWTSSENVYVASMPNAPDAYTPSRYFYTPTNLGAGSFRLEWDQKMTRADWSAGVHFGLYSHDMHLGVGYAGGPNPGVWGQSLSAISLEYAHPDPGHLFILRAVDASGKARQYDIPGDMYSVNTWYHNVLEYDEATRAINARVTVRDTGAAVVDLWLAGFGPFSPDMRYLGGSRYPLGEDGGPGTDPAAVATAAIDNVRLYGQIATVPEPASWLLALLGSLVGLLAWRRRRQPQ